MNLYRTILDPKIYPFLVDHSQSIFCIGSCFTEEIGSRLESFKFNTTINPTGIIYNPLSIFHSLSRIIENRPVETEEIFKSQSRYCHWDFHSDFSDVNPLKVLDKLNEAIKIGHNSLIHANTVFITLGTANAFTLNTTGQLVANCHKVKNEEFTRTSISVDEIVNNYITLHQKITKLNPTINIVFTISPIRHIRDGLVENQLSKSKLRVAIHKLTESYQNTYYFPSYELIVDDLRDYRFYKKDLIHVNEMGVDYIWDFFIGSYFSESTLALMEKINAINKGIAHKAFMPNSDEHQNFLKGLVSKVKKLSETNPQLNFEKELNLLNQKILSSD